MYILGPYEQENTNFYLIKKYEITRSYLSILLEGVVYMPSWHLVQGGIHRLDSLVLPLSAPIVKCLCAQFEESRLTGQEFYGRVKVMRWISTTF